jgi:hypothetical protein
LGSRLGLAFARSDSLGALLDLCAVTWPANGIVIATITRNGRSRRERTDLLIVIWIGIVMQLSVISCQLSAVSRQPSAVSCQPSAISRQLKAES